MKTKDVWEVKHQKREKTGQGDNVSDGVRTESKFGGGATLRTENNKIQENRKTCIQI